MNSYIVGELVTLSASFTTRAGTPVDPATVRVQVQPPSGAAVMFSFPADPELVKDAPGEYHLDYSVSVPGDFCYRFDSGGLYQAAKEGSFTAEASCIV